MPYSPSSLRFHRLLAGLAVFVGLSVVPRAVSGQG